MLQTKRLISAFLAIVFIFSICPVFPIFADDNVIHISSEKDLVKLAKNCTLDSFSEGKTVVLEKDINLSKSNFKGIPYFKGTFNGNSHTISGFSYKEDGNKIGFFRILGNGGTIKDLTVDLSIIPSGTAEYIGGIAGKNMGTITNCSVSGTIQAKSYVGGVAGVNCADGVTINCRFKGGVYGEHYVGGICGENLGQVINCENSGYINNKAQSITPDISEIDFSNLISTENFADITDVGGICGYSAGILQGCTNTGEVGYQHLGYNVGGICGRQAAYIAGCANKGKVFGRKDVGGICGQMEPYTTLLYSENSLNALSSELNTLQSLVDNAINNTNSSRFDISNRLSSLRSYTDSAKDSIDKMTDLTTDQINSGIDSVNDYISRISSTVDEITPFVESISDQTNKISQISKNYSDAFDKLDEAYDKIDTDLLVSASDKLSAAMKDFADASKRADTAISRISTGLGDLNDLFAAIKNLGNSINDLNSAAKKISDALDAVNSALDKIIQSIKNQHRVDPNDIAALLTEMKNSVTAIKSAINLISSSAATLSQAINNLVSYINSTDIDSLERGFEILSDAVDDLRSGLLKTRTALEAFSEVFKNVSGASTDVKDAFDIIRKTTESIGDELDKTISDMTAIKNSIIAFTKQPSLEIDRISDDFIYNKNKLSSSLSEISNAIFDAGDILDDTAASLGNSFSAISNQMNNIIDCITGAIDEAENKSAKIEDYFEDVSDAETFSSTKGQLKNCKNTGTVDADLNVGGIAGSMAIEYDFDPEDDATKSGKKSLNFTYTTLAVINSCTNRGTVNVKKDYAGGIVGKSDLGTVYNSIGCGEITSKSGGYIGGIAGYSNLSIRNCSSKATLSGDKYVGGIAGSSNNINASYSIANIKEHGEYAGAITGESSGNTSGCFYVNGELGGIDGISYTGSAEQISYDSLMQRENIPDDLRFITVTFIDEDGETVSEMNTEYGGSIDKNKIPAPPQKDDVFGEWSEKDFENIVYDLNVYAQYSNYVSAIESDAKRENDIPVFVAESKFAADPKLSATKSNAAPSSAVEAWDIEINGNTESAAKMHYKLPNGISPKKVTVKTLKDGKWVTEKAEIDGSYLVFDVPAEKASIMVAKKSVLPKVIGFSTLTLAILLAVFIILKHTNFKKSAAKPA